MMKFNVNKKIVLIVSCIVVLIGIVFFIFGGNKKDVQLNSEEKITGMVTCSMNSKDEDGNVYNNKVYIDYDKSNLVTKLTYYDVTYIGDYTDSSYELTKDLIELVDTVDGINASISTSGGSMITRTTYDFSLFDRSDYKKKLGSLYDEDAYIVTNVDINYKDFIKNELNDYTCK